MAMMDLIEAAGIVGMGGAMFPTADKLVITSYSIHYTKLYENS